MDKKIIKKHTLIAAITAGLIGCGGSGGGTSNNSPQVSAGNNVMVYSGTTSVQLAATASDSDGSIASVSWEQTQGPSATLSSNSVLNPFVSFDTSETAQTAEFRITVTDDQGATATDDVTLTKLPDTLVNFWGDSFEGIYIEWGTSSLNVYQHTGSCSIANTYLIDSYENGVLTLREPVTNETRQTTFVMNNGTLEFTPPGQSTPLRFTLDERVPFAGVGCQATKQVRIDITVRDLPEQIMVNRFDEGGREYFWGVAFDLNHTGSKDIGDIELALQKISRNFSPNEIVNINDLQAKLWVATSEQSARSSTISEGTVEYSGDTLSIIFSDRQSELIKYITSDTPISITSTLKYPAPEVSPYGSNTIANDGPWHWSASSELHTDRLPESGYSTVQSGTTQSDNLNDQEGEAAWIDIESVTITLTDL